MSDKKGSNMKIERDSNGLAVISNDEAYKLYLDYFNNYLTVDRFAEDYGLIKEDASHILYQGWLVSQLY